MPNNQLLITTPWSDVRKGSKAAVVVKEVSGPGIISIDSAAAAVGWDVGTPHPEDGTFTCADWGGELVGPGLFKLTYSFTIDDQKTMNLGKPLRIKWGFGLCREPFDRDIDGNPIVNSARSPYDPPTDADVTEVTFQIRRWEPTPYNIQKGLLIIGHVNNADCKLMGHDILEGQCKCEAAGPLTDYTLAAREIEVGYDFRLRAKGFDLRLLDQGLTGYRDVGAIKGLKIVTTELFRPANPLNGESKPVQISSPVRLNGKGKPLDTTLVGENGDPLVELPAAPDGATVETVTGKLPDGSDGVIAVFLHYKRCTGANFSTQGL